MPQCRRQAGQRRTGIHFFCDGFILGGDFGQIIAHIICLKFCSRDELA